MRRDTLGMMLGAALGVGLIAMWLLGERAGLVVAAVFLGASVWGHRARRAGWR